MQGFSGILSTHLLLSGKNLYGVRCKLVTEVHRWKKNVYERYVLDLLVY